MKTLFRFLSLIALASFACGCASNGQSVIGNWLSPWQIVAGHESAIGHDATKCTQCLGVIPPPTLPRNPFYGIQPPQTPDPVYTRDGTPQLPQPGGQYRDHLGRIHTVR